MKDSAMGAREKFLEDLKKLSERTGEKLPDVAVADTADKPEKNNPEKILEK